MIEFDEEDERKHRAAAFLDTPIARRVFNALDILGWMVVPQPGTMLPHENGRWPVPIGTKAKWPSWCDHSFAQRAQKKAAVVKLVPSEPAPSEPA
jgi:hypothetical protein